MSDQTNPPLSAPLPADVRELLLDELREVWLDEWRTRWEHEHTEEEMDEAADADSSFGGHPYWTEPTEQQLNAYADAAWRAFTRRYA